MSIFKETVDKLGISVALLRFLWDQKLWWLLPFVFVLLLLGVFIVVGSATGVGPFVYTLF